MHNVRVVNRRFSSRYVVRGFGFCDLNSPDISKAVIGTILGTILVTLRMVPVDDGAVIKLSLEAIRSATVTKLN